MCLDSRDEIFKSSSMALNNVSDGPDTLTPYIREPVSLDADILVLKSKMSFYLDYGEPQGAEEAGNCQVGPDQGSPPLTIVVGVMKAPSFSLSPKLKPASDTSTLAKFMAPSF
jgi:hypothetical protein